MAQHPMHMAQESSPDAFIHSHLRMWEVFIPDVGGLHSSTVNMTRYKKISHGTHGHAIHVDPRAAYSLCNP